MASYEIMDKHHGLFPDDLFWGSSFAHQIFDPMLTFAVQIHKKQKDIRKNKVRPRFQSQPWLALWGPIHTPSFLEPLRGKMTCPTRGAGAVCVVALVVVAVFCAGPAAAQAHFEPSLFALAPNLENDTVCELNHFSTYHLQITGSRKNVVCACTLDVVAHLQTGMPQMKDVYSFIKQCTLEQAKSFMQHAPMFQATVHSGEVIYLPAGWVFREQPEGKADCVGCRAQSLSKHDAETLEKMEVHLAQCGKPSENVRLAKDSIYLAS